MNLKIKKILSKKDKAKIVSLTAYSDSIAKILDKFCDIILDLKIVFKYQN